MMRCSNNACFFPHNSEYRAIISTHPRLSAFHPKEMAEAFLKGSLKPFDFAASFSSIEHSGLGRYGAGFDPQNGRDALLSPPCIRVSAHSAAAVRSRTTPVLHVVRTFR